MPKLLQLKTRKKTMKPITKLTLRVFLTSGIIYATIIAGFDYCDGNEFRLWKFIYNTSFFGMSMAFMARYSFKKYEFKKE
jgi:hypothetical protein